MDITTEYLEDHGWFRSIDELDAKIDNELGWKTYKRNISVDSSRRFYPITIKWGASNYYGRNWSVHVDNWLFETIGSADIQTVEQFNRFMEVLDINYKL